LGGSVCTSRTFLFVDQSSSSFFPPTWKGLWLIKFFFRCSICRSVPEIFAINSKIVRNHAEIWTFFGHSKFWGLTFRKWYPHYHPFLAAHGLEKFREGTPTSREVIGAHTLDFRPNYKFLPIFFFGGGPPSLLWCTLFSLAQSLACIKNLRGQHPLMAEMLSPEKCPLGWLRMHL